MGGRSLHGGKRQRCKGSRALHVWVYERDHHQAEAWANLLNISELQGACEAQWGSQLGYFPGQRLQFRLAPGKGCLAILWTNKADKGKRIPPSVLKLFGL